MEKTTFRNVDEYLSQFEGVVREKLNQCRELILKTVPEADESLSYGMPAYKFQKKPLVYFAGYQKHIGFYATPNTHESFQKELSSYKQGKGSVQFPLDKDLPEDLIRQMILFRKEAILNKGKY